MDTSQWDDTIIAQYGDSQPQDGDWGTSGRVCRSLVVYNNFVRQILVKTTTMNKYKFTEEVKFSSINAQDLGIRQNLTTNPNLFKGKQET